MLWNIMITLINFIKDEDGVTAIEYGLIASLIALAIILALTATGTSLKDIFDTISKELDGVSTA